MQMPTVKASSIPFEAHDLHRCRSSSCTIQLEVEHPLLRCGYLGLSWLHEHWLSSLEIWLVVGLLQLHLCLYQHCSSLLFCASIIFELTLRSQFTSFVHPSVQLNVPGSCGFCPTTKKRHSGSARTASYAVLKCSRNFGTCCG